MLEEVSLNARAIFKIISQTHLLLVGDNSLGLGSDSSLIELASLVGGSQPPQKTICGFSEEVQPESLGCC